MLDQDIRPDMPNDYTPPLGDSLALEGPFGDPSLLADVDIRFGYLIGEFRFVLSPQLITEVLTAPNIFAIPRSQAWLTGLINLRGNIVPVFDICAYLGTALRTRPGQFVLVIDKGKNALGLVIDALPVALNSPQAAESGAPGTCLSEAFLRPGVVHDEQSWAELDIKTLVRALKDGKRVERENHDH